MKTFLVRLFSTLRTQKIAFPLGIIFGLTGGITLVLLNSSNDAIVIALVAGAVLSVIIERVFDFSQTIVQEYKSTHPLRKILGTLASDDAFIYVSPFYRDVGRPEESKLYRYEKDRVDLPLIRGTQYVYGRGDALALSYVLACIDKNRPKSHLLLVEDDWQALEKWGKSAVCIGAHNAKTREILAKFSDIFYKFCLNYKAICRADMLTSQVENQGRVYVPAIYPRKTGDSSVTDYGIILKLKDEFHSNNSSILVIAGIGDWGTAGAAYFLSTRFKELPYDKDVFGVIVEVPSGYQSARLIDFDSASDFVFLGEGG